MHIATLAASHPLTPKPVCIVSSPQTWRPSSPLRRPLGPALARRLPGSRNNSTSHKELLLSTVEAGHVENAPNSTFLSPDQFAEQVLLESTRTRQADLAREAPSQRGYPNPVLLLMNLFDRLVPRGLVPQLTAEPPTSTPVGYEPSWTVTISLPELGIDVNGRGSNILFAEVAAAIQFDLALSSPDMAAKLQSFPKIPALSADPNDTVLSYWQLVHASAGPLKRTLKELDSGAYESRIFAGSTEIAEPVTTAAKNASRRIQNLTLAHAVVSGHPDSWPVGLEDPFQAKIVLDRARLEKLQNLITAATDYLRTTPGQLVGGRQHRAFHKVVQGGTEQDAVDVQEGGSEVTTHREIPDLQSWLAALPFPPPWAKMLVAGASIRCLEHAILLAAVEKHAVYRETASRAEEVDSHRSHFPGDAMGGDHGGLALLFQRLRHQSWIGKKHMRLPSTEDGQEESSRPHDNAQQRAQIDVTPGTNDPISDHERLQASPNSFPESVQTSSTKEVIIARRFGHFDPHGIASVSASAKQIERSMITAGLVSYPRETSDISVPGSDLKIRAEPYGGGDLNRQTHQISMLRRLLVLGFPGNIAQIGHGALAPGQPPQLRINSQEVYVDSRLKAHMPQKHLQQTLRAGPLVVVTGVTDNPEGGRLSARYCTPISTWEAVLLGKDLTLPDGKETSAAGAIHMLVNKWLPVLVKSEVEGVSNEEARDTLLKAREVLHRAIDKAMYDYVKYSWNSLDFYNLLMGLPNEESFLAKAIRKEKGDAIREEPRRPRPRKYQPGLKHETIKDVEN